MAYQDKWVRGGVAQKGYRECAKRYEIVKAFCAQIGRPFTVCDIGANWCYFGLRLTEDFPDCTVIAFEFNSFEARLEHLRKNEAERILLLNNKLHLADFRILSRCCHFDVVLALSVIHHLDGSFDDRMAALRGLGDNLLIEFAIGDSPRVDYQVPTDGVILGHGESHKRKGTMRPIILLPGSRA